MLQLECVLYVIQLVKYSFSALLEKREENARNVAESLKYNSKKGACSSKNSPIAF
jgi:hypothetical protein